MVNVLFRDFGVLLVSIFTLYSCIPFLHPVLLSLWQIRFLSQIHRNGPIESRRVLGQGRQAPDEHRRPLFPRHHHQSSQNQII